MKAFWMSMPTTIAIRAAPMLEEYMNTSGTERARFICSKSWIVKRPI